MKEFLRRFNINSIIVSWICVGLGLVLILFPEMSQNIICKTVAAVIIVFGVVNIGSYLSLEGALSKVRLIMGIIITLVGLFLFFEGALLLQLIPILVGIILLFHAYEDFKFAFEVKNGGDEYWWSSFLFGVLNVIFALVCIIGSYKITTGITMILGIALIYDGLSDLWVIYRANKNTRKIRKAAAQAQADSDALDVTDSTIIEDEN